LDINTAEIDSEYTLTVTLHHCLYLIDSDRSSLILTEEHLIIFERPAAVKLMRPELGRDSYFPPFKIWAQIYCMCMEIFFFFAKDSEIIVAM